LIASRSFSHAPAAAHPAPSALSASSSVIGALLVSAVAK